MKCMACGTLWRIWTDLRVAKPLVEWHPQDAVLIARQVRRAPVLDIDRVIDLVAAELADANVVQHQDAWPLDDDGVWFFSLPKVVNNIQIESSTGMCPFVVEHSGMPSPAQGGGWIAKYVEEAARTVIDYLRAQRAVPRGEDIG